MKNKILKTCFVGCLATCLTLTGIFAFAPLGASAQVNSSNQNSSLSNDFNNYETQTTEFTGLITPRADDPVLFTTESGLEIKDFTDIRNMYTGSAPESFPYFTTTNGSNIYTWVIIGQGAGESIYSPAHQAMINDKNRYLISAFGTYDLKFSYEIPIGHYLCVVTTSLYSTDQLRFWSNVSGNSAAMAFNHADNTMRAFCESLYNDDYFGFNSIPEKPVCMTLEQTNGTAVGNRTKNTTKLHLFPLDGGSYATSFRWDTYLTRTQLNIITTASTSARFSGRSDNYTTPYDSDYLYVYNYSADNGAAYMTKTSGGGGGSYHVLQAACVIALN